MEFIENDAEDLNIPDNFSFIAKGGATITWFKDIAYPKLIQELDNRNKNHKYHVVINMGVNDTRVVDNIEDRVVEYFSLYKKLADNYSDVNFYLLSVNPVQNKELYDDIMAEVRNHKIMDFNSKIDELLENNKRINMYSCDSFNNVNFETYDGLHYDDKTNQLILNYIDNKCIKYSYEKY